jgi:hypothetical protein
MRLESHSFMWKFPMNAKVWSAVLQDSIQLNIRLPATAAKMLKYPQLETQLNTEATFEIEEQRLAA